MSQYPQDEFDRIPEKASRHGVHRERLVAVRGSGLGLKIAVGILALLVGLAAYFLLPRLELGSAQNASAANARPSATAGETASPSPERMRSPEASGTPSASDPASPSPSASASPEAPAVDKSQRVNVLNGTGVPGLAGTVAGRLGADGWTGAAAGNWAGAPLEASVVFYNGLEQRAGAEAVAAVLGIAGVQDGAGVSPDLTVVVGPDLQ
ncbi:LytR C-terminal domain-containing protein [Arthrobacter sp. TMN-37]